MFGEPGNSTYQSWFDFIIYGAVLLTIIWVFFKFLDTKVGKKAEKVVNKASSPVLRWYENLSFNVRNVVGWLAIAFYCFGVITLFVWLEG